MIQDRLKALRSEMAKRGISLYVVPTADFHESEYVGEHFKARKYITGFTGSAGTAVITMDEAGLWTDGRYFVQAAAQLKDTTVKLFKIGEEGVPTVDEYIKDTLSDGGVIGFDGRVVNAAWGKRLSEIAKEKHGSMYVNEDLIDLIWTDRPPMSKAPVMIFDNKYTGEDISSKLKRVREQMAQKGATLHLMSSLYDIAWLLNVRGGDISYVPVVLSYLALSQDSCIWFLQEEVVTETLKAYLDKNGIQTRPYDDFYEYVKHIDEKETVLLNTSIVNYRICDSLPDGVKVIDAEDPTVVMKAVKNEVQLENLRKAHLKDAVAMCKFMYWLKTNIGKISMTEISASDYLASLRAEQEGFLDLSFATICGYADRLGAIHRGFSSIDQKIYRNAPMWHIPIELHRRFPNLPVICDPSHIGGRRDLIAPLCQQAMDMGFSGLIVESHCNPDCAWSDAKQQVMPDVLDFILDRLVVRENVEMTESLSALRKQIDELDNELMNLLTRRMRVSREIATYKKEHDMAVVQTGRYSEILDKRGAQGVLCGMDAEFVKKIYEAIHEESVRQQMDIINK